MLAPASKRRIPAVDPRIEAYANLLVERSLDVQPGWQVWINSSALGRPLVEEVVRLIARRGAYPLVRIGGTGMPRASGWRRSRSGSTVPRRSGSSARART